MDKNKIYIYLAIALIIGLLLGRMSFYFSNQLPYIYKRSKTYKLLQLTDLINQKYVENVNTDSIVDDVITRILRDLDPHSLYFTSSEYTNVAQETNGMFNGIGISYNTVLDTPVILQVFDNSPAKEAGLHPGDMILKINDNPVIDISVDSVSSLIASLTQVNLLIKRKFIDSVFEVKLKKSQVNIPSVFSYKINDSLCFIYISSFTLHTYDEFLQIINSCDYEKLRGIILDLRDNTGGTLSSAYDVLQEFFPKKTLLFYIKSKNHIKRKYISKHNGRLKDLKLAVLINSSTASASELIAGAVQDNDRGVIIGTQSFGKGLVQTEYHFPDGSVVRLTTAKYYTPSGRCLQKAYIYSELPLLEGSIIIDSSKKFFTQNKRVIYGGGGIIPDIIKHDTLDLIPVFYYTKLLVNQANEVEKYKSINEIKNFVDSTFESVRIRFSMTYYFINSFLGLDSALNFYNNYSPVFNKAVEILQDTNKYKQILTKPQAR